jgi:hypothetical protein
MRKGPTGLSSVLEQENKLRRRIVETSKIAKTFHFTGDLWFQFSFAEIDVAP